MTTTQQLITDGMRSHQIEVKTDAGQHFKIPVIDVRDGDNARELIKQIIKRSSRSKYMSPSFSVGGNSYQVSAKKL